MAHARLVDGTWQAIGGGEAVEHDGIVASFETIQLWSVEEREAFGVFEVGEGVPPPDGQRIVSSEIGDRDGRPVWVNTFEPIPAPPPITLTAAVLFFERMTDAEYGDLDASVKAGETARVYRGWAAATSFTQGSALWALLDKHLALVVSDERRAELLARDDASTPAGAPIAA